MSLLIDVRTREEYYMDHIKGALNIPVWDLEFYLDFLKGEKVKVYCGSRGKRSGMAVEYLNENGVDAEEIPPEELENYEYESREVVTAINYLSVKPGHEDEFEEKVEDLCEQTMDKPGFIGTKVFRTSNISFGGGMIPGEYEEIEIKPTKYVMLTYWTDKQSHEEFHDLEGITQGFKEIMPHIAITPHEVFAEIIH
uniref:Protein containing Antibiotic biosynthesis monooxygenase domain protein n=1 Tax=uncultured organism TaxID=155900 RepID=M1PVL6_9ZZZZ|nr:protein containing Antibiotic biosynthesis monooxygenase domain protein [uncultured organism]